MAVSKNKYSIPPHYSVQVVNGAQGIARDSKKGRQWMWPTIHEKIIIAKAHGKILVAYREVGASGDGMRLASYDKTKVYPYNIYDILFGENCVLIYTDFQGARAWVWLPDDLGPKGAKVLGDLELVDRDKQMPNHIAIGVTEVRAKKPNGELVIVKVVAGELVPDKSIAAMSERVVKRVEPEFSHYKVMLADEKIKLLSCKTGNIIKESSCVGEIEAYSPIIEAMMGGSFENVNKTVAEKMIVFMSKFEHYVHGMVLPIMFDYARKNKKKRTADEIFDCMLDELENGEWVKVGVGKAQVYTMGTMMVTLVKIGDGRISAIPYDFDEDDGDSLGEGSEENLAELYAKTGKQSAKLKITSGNVLREITNEEELVGWPLPYAVSVRKEKAEQMLKPRYAKIQIAELECLTVPDKQFKYCIAICDRLIYRPKKKENNKAAEWVTTNNVGLQMIGYQDEDDVI